MARGFGSAVHREVLGRGHHFQIFRVVALQSLDELHGHAPHQVRIFAVGLHAAAPARVAHQVDVRRPERQALIDAAFAAPDELVVLGAGLIGDRRGHAEDQVGIPRGGETDRHRKHRRAAGAGDAVQAFVPPVVSRNAEPLDGRRIVHHLRDLLLRLSCARAGRPRAFPAAHRRSYRAEASGPRRREPRAGQPKKVSCPIVALCAKKSPSCLLTFSDIDCLCDTRTTRRDSSREHSTC